MSKEYSDLINDLTSVYLNDAQTLIKKHKLKNNTETLKFICEFRMVMEKHVADILDNNKTPQKGEVILDDSN